MHDESVSDKSEGVNGSLCPFDVTANELLNKASGDNDDAYDDDDEQATGDVDE